MIHLCIHACVHSCFVFACMCSFIFSPCVASPCFFPFLSQLPPAVPPPCREHCSRRLALLFMFSGTRLPVASDRSVGLRASMKSVVTEERLEWSWGLATQSSGGAPGCDKACDVAPSVNWSRPPWSLCGEDGCSGEAHNTIR